MAKLALYQKYRSSTFEEVVGQEYIVKSIQNAVRENKVGHAYLFCGPRGTGKTTMARLLAKAVNCDYPEKAPCEKCPNCIAANNGTHPDIIEINAANETHVEDIRDLIERSTLAPMQGKHKIYIIDEVHQLSGAASSALLKTLEEPPENVIFILATTDPQKLLPTIISRCQRYDFTKVKREQIKKHLLDIAGKEKIKMEPEAANMIAVLAEGGMRDALSIMDQCASYTSDNITLEDIDRIYGLTTVEEKIDLLKDIFAGNVTSMIRRIQSYEEQGIDLLRFTDGMIEILKDCIIYQKTKNQELMKALSSEQSAGFANIVNTKTCMHDIELLIDAKQRFKFATSATTTFEVACLSIMNEEEEEPAKEVVISKIETKQVEDTASDEVVSEPSEPEEIEEPQVIELQPTTALSIDDIISILVQCNKQTKASDENTIAMVHSYGDLKNRKYTSLLEDAKVGASGNDCILLVVPQVIANRINDKEMNRELYFFMKDTMDTDKMLFATTAETLKEAVQKFATLMKVKQLPEAMKIEKYQLNQGKEEKPEEKVLNLFGEENVIVQ